MSCSRYFCNWLSCLITNVEVQLVCSELDLSAFQLLPSVKNNSECLFLKVVNLQNDGLI